MNSLTFPALTSFQLNWTLTDSQQPPQPINGATMQATLYAGRSIRNPDQIPGTPVQPIVGLVLPYISAGLYGTTVPGTLDPPLNGVGYVLVIDAQLGGLQIYHKEQPVVIETAGDNIDLTTVDAVKNRVVVTGSSDDAEIQAAITSFSQWLLEYTGQGTLNSIQQYDETYDGNGNNRMMLRTWPIQSLVSVTVGGAPIPILTTPSNGNWGVYVAPSQRWITMRGGVGGMSNFPYSRYMFAWGGRQRGPCFSLGIGNVEIVYNAGYPDTPPDIEYAVRCVVALNYKRKGWQDMQSKGISNTGGSSSTTRYQDWAWPPEYDKVFEQHKRMAQIL